MVTWPLIKEKNIFYFVLIFGFFPLIPNALKGLPVILLLLAAICSDIKKHTDWKWLLINSSLFLTYLLSLCYTDNFKVAANKLETALSILVIPIIFNGLLSKHNFNETQKTSFFKIFIISSFGFSIISLGYILMDGTFNYYQNWYTDKFRGLMEKVPLIGQHPIYASIFLSLSIFFLIELIKKKSIPLKQQYIFWFFAVINFLLLFLLASKGVIIGLLIVFVISALKAYNNYKTTLLFFLGIIVLLSFNRRFKEVFMLNTYTQINENYSTSIRVGIYKCAFKVICEKPLLGQGIGDAQHALNLCYANESNVLLKNRFNSHNQYLDVIIKTGVFGLIFFVLFLFANFKKAYKNKNHLLIYVFIFYYLVFLTENVLVRQSGVILFFFLINFLNQPSKIVETQKNEYSRP